MWFSFYEHRVPLILLMDQILHERRMDESMKSGHTISGIWLSP